MALAPALGTYAPSDAAPASAQVLAPSTPEVLFSEHEALAQSIATQFFARTRPTLLERDDLLQEARIGLWSAAQRFDSARGAFEPFARRTILGALLHALRDAGEPASTCSLSPSDLEAKAFAFALVEPCHIEATEARLQLQALLPQLPERERLAIELHHLQGESKVAIAQRLGVSERHAARILDDALKQLQVLAAAL